MQQIPIKLGPLALLLSVITICLTVLAILSVSTAGADERLSERYADTVRTRYALEREGQDYLRQTRAALESGAALPDEPDEDGVIRKTLTQDDTRLHIGLRCEGGRVLVVQWQQDKLWEQDEYLDLWPGQ